MVGELVNVEDPAGGASASSNAETTVAVFKYRVLVHLEIELVKHIELTIVYTCSSR